MTKKKKNFKGCLPRWAFISKPSDDALVLQADGVYLSSRSIALSSGVSHASVMDSILQAVPPSMLHDLIRFTDDGCAEVHRCLLPDFNISVVRMPADVVKRGVH